MKKYYSFILIIGTLLLQSCGNSTNSSSSEIAVDSVVVEPIAEEVANSDSWKLQYFIDDYGEKTDEGYIINNCFGEFSNSATTDSELAVRIIVTPEDVRFDMYEYGSQFMKGEGILQFRAKLPDNSEVNFTTYNSDSGPNSVSSSDVKKVRELFEKYSKLRFAAKTTSYSTSTYRFVYEGNPDEFIKELSKLSSK